MYQITIPGQPQGKARAKVYTNKYTGKAHGVTPEKTVNYENLIKTIFIQKYGQPLSDKPIHMILTAYYVIPKSTSKTQRALMNKGDIRPCKKPDLSNIIKAVEDGLNEIAYHDDSQIVSFYAVKWYSETPRVEIELRELGV